MDACSGRASAASARSATCRSRRTAWREALITGGLPGLDATADDVYRLTYAIVAARNAAHYDRYPGDVDRARAVARHLAAHDVRAARRRRG